jgi:hypothetical protein
MLQSLRYYRQEGKQAVARPLMPECSVHFCWQPAFITASSPGLTDTKNGFGTPY